MPPVAAEPFLARPHRLRILALVAVAALVVLSVLFWFAMPAEIRVLFTLSQRLTLLGVLGSLILTTVLTAASYVRADTEGLRFRNGLRTHQVPWARVHKILLRRGDPWAQVLLTPADGSEFEADLDAEKHQLMGIQATDGVRAQQAVEELRLRHQAYRAAR
jgi:asparagine N-glycosylation enzyme membrane subunit Stt3